MAFVDHTISKAVVGTESVTESFLCKTEWSAHRPTLSLARKDHIEQISINLVLKLAPKM